MISRHLNKFHDFQTSFAFYRIYKHFTRNFKLSMCASLGARCIQYVWNWFGYFISQDFTVQTRVRIEYLHPLDVIVTQSSQLEESWMILPFRIPRLAAVEIRWNVANLLSESKNKPNTEKGTVRRGLSHRLWVIYDRMVHSGTFILLLGC